MATLTAPPAATLTYEACMAEPEIQGRYDIVHGVRVSQPKVSWRRQRIIGNLSRAMSRYERPTGCQAVISPFDVLIRRTPLQIRQPDILLISHDRLRQGGGSPEIGPLGIGPKLVVEIILGNDTEQTLRDKIADYRAIRVDECWVVRPKAGTVELLILTPRRARSFAVYGEREIFSSLAFRGLGVPVADVLAA